MLNNKYGFDYHNIQAYRGNLVNDEELKRSSSGGAARALIEGVLRERGVVFGVKYTDDFYSAEYCYIENLSEIEKIIGSKYIYTDKIIDFNGERRPLFPVVLDFLKKNRKVLFIGLGCDISALKSYLKKESFDERNLYLVDLICQGPTYPKAQEDYIKRVENKFHSKAIEFSVRYKKWGWTPPFIKIRFENGKKYEESLYGSDFGYSLMNCSREYCYKCKNKGNNRNSDITIGDFWGFKEGMEGYNPNGVSVLLVRTEHGKELLKYIDEKKFQYKLANVELALSYNPMYYKSRDKYKGYDIFKENMLNVGLHRAVIKEVGMVQYYITRVLRKGNVMLKVFKYNILGGYKL